MSKSENTELLIVRGEGKKQQVTEMFDNIANSYDFLNHFLSFNIDKVWRKKAIDLLKDAQIELILDVATGTGDFALEIYKHLQPARIIGVDISQKMLKVGEGKIEKKGLSEIIKFKKGDAEHLDFPDNVFDAITVAFGVRNFEDLRAGLSEMKRVLKPGGRLIILEFSQPVQFPIKQLYALYSNHILPRFGKLFSKDKAAYTYLPKSVNAFPYGQNFADILTSLGFSSVYFKPLSFGIATVYCAEK